MKNNIRNPDEEQREMEKIILFSSDARGQYIPQHFADSINRSKIEFTGFTSDDLDILAEGPENEHYWDIWNDVLNGTITHVASGHSYGLYQDGDFWLIRSDAVAGVDHQLWDEDKF